MKELFEQIWNAPAEQITTPLKWVVWIYATFGIIVWGGALVFIGAATYSIFFKKHKPLR